MKKLEKRVERELVDILYSIIKSITYNPSSVTINLNLNEGIKVMINKVINPEYLFPLHSVAIINEQYILALTTLIINPYEAGYTIQFLNFDKKVQGLKEKRWLVERLKK